MKRIIVIWFVIGAVLFLAGCGTDKSTTTVFVPVPVPQATAQPTPAGDTGLVCQVSCQAGAVTSVQCGPDTHGKSVPTVGDCCPCASGKDSCYLGF